MPLISREEWDALPDELKQPRRQRIGRDPNTPEPNRSNVGRSITTFGQLPGAPGGFGAGNTGFVVREEPEAPGTRYASGDDVKIEQFSYGDGQTGLRRVLQSAAVPGGRVSSGDQSANIARAMAKLAQDAQVTGAPASLLPGARPDTARSAANRDVLVQLEALSDTPGMLTPELGVRIGEVMESTGLGPREATQLAVVEAQGRSRAGFVQRYVDERNLSPKQALQVAFQDFGGEAVQQRIAALPEKIRPEVLQQVTDSIVQQGLAEAIGGSAGLRAIERGSEITNQTIKEPRYDLEIGPSREDAARAGAVSREGLTSYAQNLASQLMAEEESLKVSGHIDSRLRQDLEARLDQAVELLNADPAETGARVRRAAAQLEPGSAYHDDRYGDAIERAENAFSPWDNPNDPGARASGDPLRQLSKPQTQAMALRTAPTPGTRSMFSKEPKSFEAEAVPVPVLVGRTTEPVMTGSEKKGTLRQVVDPVYEREVSDANWQLALARSRGYDIDQRLGQLATVVYAPGEPEERRLIELQQNPRGKMQTPTVESPMPTQEYREALNDARKRASGDVSSPQVQQALLEVKDLLANPQWQRWDKPGDSGKIKTGGRLYDPDSVGVVLVNPTAMMADHLDEGYRGRQQGPTTDGSLGGITGVPSPEVRGLAADGLGHGFTEAQDPGAKGYANLPQTVAQRAQSLLYEPNSLTPIKPVTLDGPTPTVKTIRNLDTGKTEYRLYAGDWQGNREPQLGQQVWPLLGEEPVVNRDGVKTINVRVGSPTEYTTVGLGRANDLIAAITGAPLALGGAGLQGRNVAVVNQQLTDEGMKARQQEVLGRYIADDGVGGKASAAWNVIKAIAAGAGVVPDEVQRPMVEPPGSAKVAELEAWVDKAMGDRRTQLSRVRQSVGMEPLLESAGPSARPTSPNQLQPSGVRMIGPVGPPSGSSLDPVLANESVSRHRTSGLEFLDRYMTRRGR